MDLQTKRDVMHLAEAQALEWFETQTHAEVPEPDPEDASWGQLNHRYPDNAARSAEHGPTPMDRLFEAAYRAEMARLWRDESERKVRMLLTEESDEAVRPGREAGVDSSGEPKDTGDGSRRKEYETVAVRWPDGTIRHERVETGQSAIVAGSVYVQAAGTLMSYTVKAREVQAPSPAGLRVFEVVTDGLPDDAAAEVCGDGRGSVIARGELYLLAPARDVQPRG